MHVVQRKHFFIETFLLRNTEKKEYFLLKGNSFCIWTYIFNFSSDFSPSSCEGRHFQNKYDCFLLLLIQVICDICLEYDINVVS